MADTISTPPRLQVGLACIDPIGLDAAVKRVVHWAEGSDPTKIVVTPNIQHIDLLSRDSEFLAAYQRADLVLADGWPVAAVASLAARRRLHRAAGSDLTAGVIGSANRSGVSIAFFGGAPGSGGAAARNCRQVYPSLRIVQIEPMAPQELCQPDYVAKLRERIDLNHPNVIVLGLGSPKQEKFADRHLKNCGAQVVLCVGASIDFLAGSRRRAPRMIQKVGLEWVWRLLLEPRRLAGRYARSAIMFPIHLLRQSK